MALVFSKAMTALLAREEITSFFTSIARRRVEDVLKEREFPLLGVAVSDNEQHAAAGDGQVTEQANYTLLLATRLGAGQAQDEALAGMDRRTHAGRHADTALGQPDEYVELLGRERSRCVRGVGHRRSVGGIL